MKTKPLFVATAVIEAGTGLALLFVSPALPAVMVLAFCGIRLAVNGSWPMTGSGASRADGGVVPRLP